MSEMVLNDDQQTFQNYFDALSPAQQRSLVLNAAINQNQQRLLAPPIANQMRKQPFEAPETFGQGLRNIGANLKNNLLRGIGAAPSYRQMAAQIDRDQYERDLRADQTTRLRAQLARQALISQGRDPNIVNSLGSEQLFNVIENLNGPLVYDQQGRAYTRNRLTGQITNVVDQSPEFQRYYMALAQGPNFNAAQQRLFQGTETETGTQTTTNDTRTLPTFEEFTRGAGVRQQQETKALTQIEEWGKQYRDGAVIAANQLPRLNMMIDLLNGLGDVNDQPLTTGALASLKERFGSLGYDLGLTDDQQTAAQVFRALSTQVVIPVAKQLGVNPTDKDVELIFDSAPELAKSPEGNRILLQTFKIIQERAQLLQNEYLRFQDENIRDFNSNPIQFRLAWDRRLNQIQQSPEYKGLDLATLRAQSNAITDPTGTGYENAADAFDIGT